MKREVKFRGKPIDKDFGAWIHGHYTVGSEIGTGIDKHYIESKEQGGVEVAQETVGQFTELRDIDGREIYEGDVLEKTAPLPMTSKPRTIESRWGAYNRQVVFKEGAFVCLKSRASKTIPLNSRSIRWFGLRVCGNLIDKSAPLKQTTPRQPRPTRREPDNDNPNYRRSRVTS